MHWSKKTSQLRITCLYEGNSPETGEFPAQRTSNAEKFSIWWRHHDTMTHPLTQTFQLTQSLTDWDGVSRTITRSHVSILSGYAGINIVKKHVEIPLKYIRMASFPDIPGLDMRGSAIDILWRLFPLKGTLLLIFLKVLLKSYNLRSIASTRKFKSNLPIFWIRNPNYWYFFHGVLDDKIKRTSGYCV